MNELKIDAGALDLWNRAKMIMLGMMQSTEEKAQAERYLSMITSVTSENGGYIVYTSNDFAAKLIDKEYSTKLKTCVELAGGKKDITINFEADDKKQASIVIPESPQPTVASGTVQGRNNLFISTMPLDPSYTFEEFVRGPSNSLANATAMSVADKPGRKGYNPLFIYGGTGLGKTHLMQAIGNELKRKQPDISVCYLTAEAFLNEFINSIQNGNMEKFRGRYRGVDILMVDDVQFIAQRKQMQEEFFNTFESLYGAGKQIVMTCDVAPKNLHGFEQRLISRFEGGMVQEIELPSYETRLAILRKKAESMSQPIPDHALKFIAENIKTHVRAMEGALAKVNLMMDYNRNADVNDEILYHLLNDFIEKEKNLKKITIEDIQNTICKKYSLTMAQILSSERTQSLVVPRQLAMYIARKYTNKSLPEIAKMFDKSHATILHGVKTISKRLEVEPDLRNDLESIISEFGYNIEDTID